MDKIPETFGKYFNKLLVQYIFVIEMTLIENIRSLVCTSCNKAHRAVTNSRYNEVFCNSCGFVII